MQKVKPIREGYHTLTPNMVMSDAAAAIEFYKKAFGAQELMRMPSPDGKGIWHAEIKIGDSHLFMADESVSMGVRSPKTLGQCPVTLQLNVEDADATFNQAVAAGAKVAMPLTDMFWGDRYGHVTDPFGYTWAISTHIKDLTPEEMRKAGEAFAAQAAQKK